jgi:hypothetical protein
MSNPILDSEPEIRDHLKSHFEYHEIRGEQALLIEQWFSHTIVLSDILNLFRKGMIGVSGGGLTDAGIFEPKFYQIKNNE